MIGILIMRTFSFYFMCVVIVWVVCLAEDEDLFLESLLLKKYLHKSLFCFFISCFFYFLQAARKSLSNCV